MKEDSNKLDNDCSYLLHFDYKNIIKVSVEPIILKPKLAGVEIPTEDDIGAALSIISKITLERYLRKNTLIYSDARLITYSGNEIHPVASGQHPLPLHKANSKVRICGDYKVTLNPAMKIEQYPLPKIAKIFAFLGRGQLFRKIDLKQAYLQMEVD